MFAIALLAIARYAITSQVSRYPLNNFRRSKMNRFAIVASLCVTFTAPVATFAEENEGRRLADLAFSSLDTADRGDIDQGEFSNFGSDVFLSMDGDENGSLSLKEFMSWDYGMSGVAEERGRVEAYETALRIVFAFWDRDGDGNVSRTEHRQSLNFDFQRADTDNDTLLSQEEFTSGFSVMVALRAALDPNL
jgi:Ca2+-binding EF-hand superfamily protein